MPGWMNHQLESRLPGEIFNILRYADDTNLMAEREDLLRRVKEESEKNGFKLHIQKTKIMASGPITSWQIEGRKVEKKKDRFYFPGLQNH